MSSKFLTEFNSVSIMTGRKQFLYVVFEGRDGVYYDAIGDEIFTVARLHLGSEPPTYRIEFKNKTKFGVLQDHGFNFYLGKL